MADVIKNFSSQKEITAVEPVTAADFLSAAKLGGSLVSPSGRMFASSLSYFQSFDILRLSEGSLNTNGVLISEAMAIAINNAELLNSLKVSNADLLNAYETTLKGWVDALDMRDHETEGHTRRVTKLSLQLALRMGIKGSEIVNFERGALLHDIGKVGISDLILNKPGPLSEEEWVIMRQHPLYAYQLLSKSKYLIPALDIPYCHHEKWDGSGYPRGLKGEAIPLAARIFAIVDVWDALISDRPYRSAWTQKQALDYIQEQSGIHFDPKVVSAFMTLSKKDLK